MARDFAPSLFSTQITEATYYCPKRNPRPLALDIVCAGWENCRSDYLVTRTAFPWLAIEMVVRGRGWVEIQGEKFLLQAGTLFSYGPDVAYRMTTEAKRPLLKYFIDFTGTGARRMLKSGPLAPGRVLQALYPKELQDILDRILIEGTRKSKLSREIANGYLQLLLHKIHECTPGQQGEISSRALESYVKAKALLDKECHQISSARLAAEKLGITPEMLCRLFQRFSKTSPYQYLLRLKINRAVDLLLGTDIMVKEVGQRAGFDDPFHFSRIFKRLQGTSPAHFRSVHRRSSR